MRHHFFYCVLFFHGTAWLNAGSLARSRQRDRDTTTTILTMNQMQPIAKIRMPNRIPKNPTVATLVVGLPHCEVTTTKETIAKRMPMPMVIRTGFHEAFSGAGLGSIYVPSSDRREGKPPVTDAET